jgi:ABC-2 type transport system ATP-binding protein
MAAAGIRFDDVSKFYGEVLGVNHVTLDIPPGITSLVGPNGAGKSTLMNLLAGLIQPSRGRIQVLGVSSDDPERLFRLVGYSPQYDSFPRGMRAGELLRAHLRLAGETENLTPRVTAALEQVGLAAVAGRKLAGFSKGMRQRMRLALALLHDPRVLILDEPLNGLDPLARAESIALFRSFAAEGRYLILSSHILHDVDAISDQLILLSNGCVVAEGAIQGVRAELPDRPLQVRIRSPRARELAATAFQLAGVIEAQLDARGVLITTRDPRAFYLALNQWAAAGLPIEAVQPADDNAQAIYGYLVEGAR